MKPLQITRPLLQSEQINKIASKLGLQIPEFIPPVVTLALSRTVVDWTHPTLTPEMDYVGVSARNAELDVSHGFTILRFCHPDLEGRQDDLCAAGSRWECPKMKPIVVLAPYNGEELDRISKSDLSTLYFELGPEIRRNPNLNPTAPLPID